MSFRYSCLLGSLALFCFAACADVRAQDLTVELDPANTKIEFVLAASLHTVHGTFALKSGAIHFNPATGSASGSVVVDVKSGQSGNNMRDHKMHKEILQSEQYPEATFTPTKMSGAFSEQGSSTIQVDGIFHIHGSDHPIMLTVPLRISGNSVSLTSQIVIPYEQWGMKNPSSFILRVNDKVELDITATGRFFRDRHP
jgi:polyisoprenoid-binding protein YceI